MTAAYQDSSLRPDERVRDLLARMTLREKVGQLNQRLLGWRVWARDGDGVRTTAELDEEIERWGSIGAIYGLLRADAWSGRDWASGADPARSREVTAAVQARVVAGSRLGIPALFVEESPHGHQALGSQLFGVNLSLAATWDPDLQEAIAAHVGRELRARGVHLTLVSGSDMLRDPRWGRGEETFGEDALLAVTFVRALVRGMTRGTTSEAGAPGLGVVLKHFAGQGAGIGGRNSSGAPLGPRELAEVHLPAARAGVEEGALGVMAAYNEIDGIPCCADANLLTSILRDQWGFEGIVMADMFAVDRLMRATSSAAQAGALALRAGVDMSMCDRAYVALEQALEEGLIDEADIDRSVARVLGVKVRLGLLDGPVEDGEAPPSLPPFPAPDAVSAQAAEAAMVLLQDRGGYLPSRVRPGRVALIGPNADDLGCLLGDYVPPLLPGTGETVLGAFARALAVEAPGGAELVHEPGSGLVEAIPGGLERAREAARGADLVVLVLGSTSERGYDDAFDVNGAGKLDGRAPRATGGEGFDVAEVELPAAQRELVAAVTEAAGEGAKLVAVIISGRPLGIERVVDACGVVLYAFYPGPDGARAIAEVVLGGREPVGRLPVSLPRSSGTLPVAYDERLETTRRYVDGDAAALFGFGAGMGHTSWRLGVPRVAGEAEPAPMSLAALAAARVEVPLTNSGRYPGSVIVQLFARAAVPGILPRRAILVGFARVRLEPGASTVVHLLLRADALPRLGFVEGVDAGLELWCSTDGAREPGEGSIRLTVRG